jgi:2EXR family
MFGRCFPRNFIFPKKKVASLEVRTAASVSPASGVISEDTLPSFPLFSKLPTELRLKIWISTIEPRVIFMLPRIRTTLPIVLQVCRESRDEGLLHYHILTYPSINLEVPGVQGRNNIDTWSRIYFSNQVDTLFYGDSPSGSRDHGWDLPWTDLPTTVQQVHHLALSRAAWSTLRYPPGPLSFITGSYEIALRNNSLKTITIVLGDFWGAVEIYKHPEILSASDLRLSSYQVGVNTADWEAWLHDLHRFNIRSEPPKLKFAMLERRSLSKFDSKRISVGMFSPQYLYPSRL